MKIKGRNILFAFGTISLLPILFIGIFLTVRMRTMAYSQSLQEAHEEITRVKNRTEEILEFIYKIQNTIISDTQILDIVQRDFDSAYDIFNSYYEDNIMDKYELIYSDIADIRIYVENESLLNNMDFMKITPEIRQQEWYREAINRKGQSLGAYYREGPINQKDYLMICRSFRITRESVGVMMILVDLKRISEMMEAEPYDLFLVDSGNRIITSKKHIDSGLGFRDLVEGDITEGQEMWSTQYNGNQSQVIVKSMGHGILTEPLYLVSVIPIERMVASSREVSMFGGWVILLSLAAGLALLFGLSSLASHQQEQQYLLFKEQMRFEVLASQVNPHFLFNVLEAVRMKAHIGGETEIAAIVKKMGMLIRRNLEMSNDFITLKEELSFAEDYLMIQKFRFGDKIHSVINCSEELLNLTVLPLTLQPVIENAIIHGLEGVKENGTVTVYARLEGQKLVITVADDGKGMDPEKRMHLLEDGSRPCEEKRIGLLNIHQRLQIKFGKAYGLSIEENHPRGTMVHICMPILRMERN